MVSFSERFWILHNFLEILREITGPNVARDAPDVLHPLLRQICSGGNISERTLILSRHFDGKIIYRQSTQNASYLCERCGDGIQHFVEGSCGLQVAPFKLILGYALG